MPFAWTFTQGVGDFRTTPTLYFLKSMGPDDLSDLQTGFISTTLHDNSLLYQSAEAVGPDVLYNSTILEVERSDSHGVSIIVKQGTKLTLIKSSQLIVAVQPTLSNLAPFNLHSEREIFEKFIYTKYFSCILRNTGIPSSTSLNALDPSQEFSITAAPSLYSVAQTGDPRLLNAWYLATDERMTDFEIEATILSQVKNTQVPGKTASNSEFAVKSNHKPFTLQVSAENIRKGFYKKLKSLQGKHRTWWVSATFHTHDSILIWRKIEGMLPDITAAV